MKSEKVLVVINPVSGGSDKTALFTTITNALKEQGRKALFYQTTGQADTRKLRQEIELHQPAILMAAGGDGTVHLAAKALRKYAIPLAILPLGSGNGLSKDLGIPQEITAALGVLKKYALCAIDTLLINKRICVHVMDLGFNALVVKRFDEAETRGPGTYIKVAMQEYLNSLRIIMMVYWCKRIIVIN